MAARHRAHLRGIGSFARLGEMVEAKVISNSSVIAVSTEIPNRLAVLTDTAEQLRNVTMDSVAVGVVTAIRTGARSTGSRSYVILPAIGVHVEAR